MTVRVSKSTINLREKLSELDHPVGNHGTQLMKSADAAESFSLIQAGRKNLIINGDMIVNQRGVAAVANVAEGDNIRDNILSADRWGGWADAATKYTVSTVAITGDAANAPPGFRNSLKITSSAATATTSGMYKTVSQRIEAQNLDHLALGTINAKNFTVSFWVKSSLTGRFSATIHNNALTSGRSYPFVYLINKANTWEWKSVTIMGDTISTGWQTSANNFGMELSFSLQMGSTYATIGDNVGWVGNWRYPTGCVNLLETNAATWYLTGVQLEEGNVATSFEHRSHAEELELCQRYCQKFGEGWWFTGYHRGGGYSEYGYCMVPLRTTMRTGPSVSAQGDNLHGYSYVPDGYQTAQLGSGRTASHIIMNGSHTDPAETTAVRIQWQSGHGWSNNDIVHYRSENADTFLILSAEL